MAKLSQQDRAEIRRLWPGVPAAELADRYGVTPVTIYYHANDGYRARQLAYRAVYYREAMADPAVAEMERERHAVYSRRYRARQRAKA